MTRSQALTIGVLVGGVILVFGALLVFILLDPMALFASSPPPATPLPPAPTPTSTLPSFMPTPGPETPTPEPTATFTRVPTVTPSPAWTATPTVELRLPTLAVRPTATPVVVDTPVIVPTVTNTASPTPFQAVRYSVSFTAEDTTITEGDCTDLEWQTEGVSDVRLDGESVSASGTEEVCPSEDREYELTVQLPDGVRIERKSVKISVESENNAE